MESERRSTAHAAGSLLLFEQEPAVRARIRRALRAEGYAVDEFEDAHDAVRALRRHRYDAVLADVFTADSEALRDLLRRDAVTAPVIAIAHSVPLRTLIDVMTELAWDFVPAATPSESVPVVRRALRHFQLQRDLGALEFAGGVMNTTRYARVMRRLNGALADLERAKRKLHARSRRRAATPHLAMHS